MKLREYQFNAANQIRHSFEQGIKNVILQIPTGGGKTIVFSNIAKLTIEKNKKVMILCDRKELITQSVEKLNLIGLMPSLIMPGIEIKESNIYCGSVDTLRRREFPDIDLLIIDECHKQTFDPIIKKYMEINPALFIIGATATPTRIGKQTSLHTIYQKIISPVTVSQLIDQKYLVDCIIYAAKENFNDVKILGGEYDPKQLLKKFNQSKLYDQVIHNWFKFAKGLKTICFNINVEHSMQTCNQFKSCGIKAVHVDGTTHPDERKKIMKDFKHGLIEVLCNCSILTTGFDEPSIQCVIINRATLSESLYLQMCGRGSRPFDGKSNFKIIDQGSNVYKFGIWSDERTFSLYKKEKRSDGIAPVKICGHCEAINRASAHKCKECNTIFPIKEKVLLKSEFVEIKSNRGVQSIAGANGSINPKVLQALEQKAKEKGYKEGWIKHQIEHIKSKMK